MISQDSRQLSSQHSPLEFVVECGAILLVSNWPIRVLQATMKQNISRLQIPRGHVFRRLDTHLRTRVPAKGCEAVSKVIGDVQCLDSWGPMRVHKANNVCFTLYFCSFEAARGFTGGPGVVSID